MYKIKLAKDLTRGDEIIIHGVAYRVDEYVQWGGAGSFLFGEWGGIKFWRKKSFFKPERIVCERTYKDAPYLVLDREERA
jgi:hypothetical protein